MANRSESGFNIVKFFTAFKTGASEAAKAASSSAGSISKFFQAFSGGAKAGWQAIPMLTKIGLGITAVSLAYTALLNREREAKISMQNEFDDAFSKASGGTDVFDAYKNYQAAQSAYDGSIESKNALESATLSLASALGKEKDEIDSIKDSLQDLTAAELLESIDQAKIAVANAGNKLLSTGTGGSWSFSDANNKGYINSFAQMMMDQSEDESMYNLFAIDSQTRLEALLNVYDAMVARRKELVDSNQTDTLAYRKLNEAINYLRPDVEDLRNSQDLLSDSTERYNAVVNNTVESVEAVSEPVKSTADNLKESSESTVKAIQSIESAQKLLSSQETGKSLSPSDLSSDEMKEYASALEYVNGAYHLSTERVNELVAAKTELIVSQNEENKALAQQKYLENAKQIEKYRRELELAKDRCDGTEIAIQANIDSLIAENSALRADCMQYDLMSAALMEATSAYQNWINAKSASQTGDMFDGALAAIKQMNDVLNNTDSDMFGRIGRTDYKAAVDFIVPDTVDHEDAAAVNAYMQSISDMFTFDDKGNQTGLNIANFIQKSLDAGLIAINEAGDAYTIAGGKTMEDFANGLGLSLPLVRAMFGELEEFGAKFDWADEATKTIGDLGVAAYESAEALRGIDQYKDMKIVMDVSEFDDASKACDTLRSTVEQMQNIKATLSVDDPAYQHANDVISYCIAQMQILSSPAIMSVDVSKVTSEIAPALDLLQQFQNAQNMLEMQAAVGADTTAAESEIDSLVAQIQGLDPEILAQLGLDPASTEAIQTYINGLDAEAIVAFGIDSSLVDAFEKASHSARGVVNWYDNTSNLSTSFTRTGYVYWKDANSPGGSTGGGDVNGSANASGSAHLRGDWRAKGGRSLVGELGREIIVDPNTGRWYTVGDNGAEFVNIPDGAIVFNHRQSDALLENGKVAGRGKAMASGSALVTGFIPIGIGNPGGGNNNGGYHNPSGGATNSVESNYDEELETFDWIEIAIDRIERIIEKFGKTAESVFKSLRTRVSATNDEIAMVSQEIGLQQRAYQKYMSAAEAVSLSSDLKQLVRNGAIDISQYDKDTQKLINDYKDLYEKALDCSASIDDLHEKLAQLYKDNFDNVQKDFENKLSLMEKQSDTYSRKIDKLEEQGYMQNANYYKQLRNTQQSNIGVLNQELVNLQAAFEAAMASGEIEEGSEAWYEMKFAIEDTKAAIEEAEIAVIKYDNTLRQIQWDYFDYAQERIGQITSEADFLLNLLDGKNMYDENGNLSETGIAAGGLHAEKYGIYMAQADKYAEEIKRINAEIANDPNNTKLIKRRDELVASQRDAILAAKSEKEALVDLAREGINVELEAVKKLIDAYTESLDSAKDLYDYQKKIADKTKNIATLEKQIAAYQNDVSEETRSKIQKIQVQLADAKDDLKETEYERLISDSKKLLDNLYSEYEDVLNSRFDDIDATFEKMIDLTNDNFISINEYLSDIADGVGYVISDEGQSVWSMGGGVNGFVSEYGKDITTKLTATGLVVENIFGLLGAIAKQNGVDFPAAKSYAAGGLIDYTGIANVHGTAGNPEMVLNASDTKNFIMLRDALRNMGGIALSGSSRLGDFIAGSLGAPSITGGAGGANGYTVGAINVTIPIERVEDYNDFVNQLRNDRQFEKMVQDITIGRVAGKSKLSKNKYSW